MRRKKDSEIEKDDEEIRPSPFTPDEAKRKIRLVLREGDTIFSNHLLRDIASSRHGVSHQDVLYVLQNGDIISPPEWDETHRSWKYKVEGADLEDEELRAITIIIEERFSIFIVTAY
jgi:hypothetical protein